VNVHDIAIAFVAWGLGILMAMAARKRDV